MVQSPERKVRIKGTLANTLDFCIEQMRLKPLFRVLEQDIAIKRPGGTLPPQNSKRMCACEFKELYLPRRNAEAIPVRHGDAAAHAARKAAYEDEDEDAVHVEQAAIYQASGPPPNLFFMCELFCHANVVIWAQVILVAICCLVVDCPKACRPPGVCLGRSTGNGHHRRCVFTVLVRSMFGASAAMMPANPCPPLGGASSWVSDGGSWSQVFGWVGWSGGGSTRTPWTRSSPGAVGSSDLSPGAGSAGSAGSAAGLCGPAEKMLG